MTFTELVVAIAVEAHLPREQVAKTLRSFIKVSRLALMSGEDVSLRTFGSFYTVQMKEKEIFGGTRKRTGRRIIRFKESRYGEVWGRDRH